MISWAAVDKSPETVGRKVQIYWPADDAWYGGVIDSHRREKGYHVKYDDGDEEWIKDLEGVKFPTDIGEDEDDGNGMNNTSEGQEHEVKSKYEESIRMLNVSEEIGDINWMEAKSILVSLLDDNSVLSTSTQLSDRMQRIKYFVCKNLCQLEDKEGNNPQQALAYGLLALQMCDLPSKEVRPHRAGNRRNNLSLPPLIAKDTLLLARVAALALQVNDLWTCHALLFSGLLKESMDHIKLDLYEKWSMAMAKSAAMIMPPTDKIIHADPLSLVVTVSEDSSSNLKPELLPLFSQLISLSTSCGENIAQNGTLPLRSVRDTVLLCKQLKKDVFASSDMDINASPAVVLCKKRDLASVEDAVSCGAKCVKSPKLNTQERNIQDSDKSSSPLKSTSEFSQDSSSRTNNSDTSVPAEIVEITDSTPCDPFPEELPAVSNKRTVRPKTDRLTRRQRQELLEKERSGECDSDTANVYSIGCLAWEGQQRLEFEKHLSNLYNNVNKKDRNNDAPIHSMHSDHIESLLTILQSNSQPLFESPIPIFPSTCSIPTPQQLLIHPSQVRNWKKVLKSIEDVPSESGSQSIDEMKSDPKNAISKQISPIINDESHDDILDAVLASEDWIVFTSMFHQQLSTGHDNAPCCVRVVDIFLAFLTCMSKTVSRMCSYAVERVSCPSMSSEMLSMIVAESMELLRTTILVAWDFVLKFNEADVECVVACLADDEALMVGECLMYRYMTSPHDDEQHSKSSSDAVLKTMVLLLERWELTVGNVSASESNTMELLRAVRIHWLVYHAMNFVSELRRNREWTSSEGNDYAAYTEKNNVCSAILNSLQSLVGHNEVCLPHLYDDFVGSSNFTSGSTVDVLPLAAIANTTHLAKINQQVFHDLRNKKKSDFLTWVQERKALYDDNDQTNADAEGVTKQLWHWLGSLEIFFNLPMSQEQNSLGSECTQPSVYSLKSLYQPHLLSPADFISITIPRHQSPQASANEFENTDLQDDDFVQLVAQSRYCFLLVLFDTAMNCLIAELLSCPGSCSDDIVPNVTICVQVLVLVLSAVESLERDVLLANPVNSKRHHHSVKLVRGIFSFLVRCMSKLSESQSIQLNLICPTLLSNNLLHGLEVLLNQWFLIIYSINSEAPSSNIVIPLRAGILKLSESLRSLSFLPSAFAFDKGAKELLETHALSYLTYIVCSDVDLRVSLPQIQESKMLTESSATMISGSPTPKKRQRKRIRKDVNAKNETVGQLNVDALLQLLGRLMPIKMKPFFSGNHIVSWHSHHHVFGGLRAVLSAYAYRVLASVNDGAFLELGSLLSTALDSLQVLPDGFALFSGTTEDVVYDSVKGTFSSKKVEKAERSILSDPTAVIAPALGRVLFECLKLILVTMTEQLFASMPSFSDNENIGSISSDKVSDIEVSLFEAYLISVKQIYESWISSKGLFFIDNGKLALFLAESLMILIKQDIRFTFHARRNGGHGQEMESGSDVDDMNSERLKSPFIEKLSDEVILDMMTLVGQIYFDIFRLPLGTAFINTKGSSMQADIFWAHNAYFLDTHVMSSKHQLFESLFTFIKYCEDDLGTSRGMSKSDIRESYGMLYQAFPFLRSPGRSDNPNLVQREADLLSLLFEKYPDGDTSCKWSIFFTTPTTCDSYLGALVQGCFDKLSYYGLVDQESYVPHNVVDSSQFADTEREDEERGKSQGLECDQSMGESADLVSVCPFPLRGGDRRSSSTVAVCQQQKFYEHPILFIPPKESVTCADINLHINTLVHYPPLISDCGSELKSDCEHAFIWLNLHEKLSTLIDYCLDDIGYNIFPVENLNFSQHYKSASEINPIQFSNGALHRHVACGTLIIRGDDAFNDVYRNYCLKDAESDENDFSLLAQHFIANERCWDEFDRPHNFTNSDCEESTDIPEAAQSFHRLFANSVHGLPQEEKSKINNKNKFSSKDSSGVDSIVSEIPTASMGIMMLFAKLSSLLQAAENVLQALLIVFEPIERMLREGCGSCSPLDSFKKRKDVAEEVKVMERLVNLYEKRCVLYSSLLKLYGNSLTGPYKHAQRVALLSARRGMELSSVLRPQADLSGPICESKNDDLGRILTSAVVDDDFATRIFTQESDEVDCGEDWHDWSIVLSDTSTNYFFPYMYGKLLYQKYQEHVSDQAQLGQQFMSVALTVLRYLFYAQGCVKRAAKLDKSEKKYRAQVVAELHRVRLSLTMRIFLSYTTDFSCIDAVQSAARLDVLELLNNPLLHEGPRPPATIGSQESSSSVEVNRPPTAAGIEIPETNNVRICLSCGAPYQVKSKYLFQYTSSLLTQACDYLVCNGKSIENPLSEPSVCDKCGSDSICSNMEVQTKRDNTNENNEQQQKVIWDIIVNSLQSLLFCTIYDSFDFKSVVIVTRFIFGLSKAILNKSSSRAVFISPPPEVISKLKGLGIELTAGWCAQFMQSRLFDKKRSQVVGVWVQEFSSTPFEMFLKRIVLYDYQRFKCINLYLEVCVASKAVSQLSDLLSWTSAAYLAGRKQRSSSMIIWAMRATALTCAYVHAQLLTEIPVDVDKDNKSCTDAATTTTVSEEIMTEWRRWVANEDYIESSLYAVPAGVTLSSLSFSENFEKFFVSVERYLSVANHNSLYAVLGDILIHYYKDYSTTCIRRYEELLLVSNYVQIDQSNTTGSDTATNEDVKDELGCNVKSATATSSDLRKVVPLPDLIRISNATLSSDSTLANTENEGGNDIAPLSEVVSVDNLVHHENSEMNFRTKSCVQPTQFASSVSVDDVLGWCRRQSGWKALRPPTALKAAIAASLNMNATSTPGISSSEVCGAVVDSSDVVLETAEELNTSSNNTITRRGSKRQRTLSSGS